MLLLLLLELLLLGEPLLLLEPKVWAETRARVAGRPVPLPDRGPPSWTLLEAPAAPHKAASWGSCAYATKRAVETCPHANTNRAVGNGRSASMSVLKGKEWLKQNCNPR
jgi:hypothetical protein